MQQTQTLSASAFSVKIEQKADKKYDINNKKLSQTHKLNIVPNFQIYPYCDELLDM